MEYTIQVWYVVVSEDGRFYDPLRRRYKSQDDLQPGFLHTQKQDAQDAIDLMPGSLDGSKPAIVGVNIVVNPLLVCGFCRGTGKALLSYTRESSLVVLRDCLACKGEKRLYLKDKEEFLSKLKEAKECPFCCGHDFRIKYFDSKWVVEPCNHPKE